MIHISHIEVQRLKRPTKKNPSPIKTTPNRAVTKPIPQHHRSASSHAQTQHSQTTLPDRNAQRRSNTGPDATPATRGARRAEAATELGAVGAQRTTQSTRRCSSRGDDRAAEAAAEGPGGRGAVAAQGVGAGGEGEEDARVAGGADCVCVDGYQGQSVSEIVLDGIGNERAYLWLRLRLRLWRRRRGFQRKEP